MKHLAAVLCWSACVFAQTVTFAPQGDAILKTQAGQAIRGVQIVDLNICAPAGSLIANGYVYQTAVANGFSPIGPTMGTALLNQKVAANWKHWLVQFMTDGALDAAIGGLTGVVAIPPGAIKGLAIGHAFLDKFSPQLLATAPTAAPVLALLLDPSRTTSFASSGCAEAAIFARYAKGSTKAVGPVPIDLSGVVFNPVGARQHEVDSPWRQPGQPDKYKPGSSTIWDDNTPSEIAYGWVQSSELDTQRLQKIMAMRKMAAEVFEKGEIH